MIHSSSGAGKTHFHKRSKEISLKIEYEKKKNKKLIWNNTAVRYETVDVLGGEASAWR